MFFLSPKFRDPFLKGLEDCVTCPITLEQIIEDAVTTNCGHTFEHKSIRRALKDNEGCPLDRTEVYALFKNCFINQISPLIQRIQTTFNTASNEDQGRDGDVLIAKLFKLVLSRRSALDCRDNRFEGHSTQDHSSSAIHHCLLESFDSTHHCLENSHEPIQNRMAEDVLEIFTTYLNLSGNTLVHLAAYLGDLEDIQRLVQNEADVNQENADGYTPYDFALANKHVPVQKLLKGTIPLEEEMKQEAFFFFSFRDPVRSFYGRQNDLKVLHRLIQTGNPVVMSGLGGVGKSELARKYICEYAQFYHDHIVWIEARDHQSLVKSFRDLAPSLGINLRAMGGWERNIKVIVEEVYDSLCKRKTFFVFNDAPGFKVNHGIKNFLRYLSKDFNRPRILITSRCNTWPTHFKSFVLDGFTPEEAIGFIKMHVKTANKEREETLEKLAKTFQCFPLALQQAAKYIQFNRKESIGIDEYLKRYERDPKKLLAFEFPKESGEMYSETTLTTWESTLDRIKKDPEGGNGALKLMHIIAYLAPDVEIPSQLFFSLKVELELGACIQLLKSYSVLNSRENPTKLSVHRLVQQVIRLKCKAQEKKILDNALKLFEGNIDLVIDHALSIWDHARKYECLVKKFSSLACNLTHSLLSQNRMEEAFLFVIQTLKLLRIQLGPNHPDVLTLKKIIQSNQFDPTRFTFDPQLLEEEKTGKPGWIKTVRNFLQTASQSLYTLFLKFKRIWGSIFFNF